MYNELQNFGPPDMNGSNMNADMAGTWIKTHPQFSGPDVLHVRDAVMDGNDMVVITDHGNISMSEFANNYFKQSEEEYNLNGEKLPSLPQSKPQLPLDSKPKPKPKLPIDSTPVDYTVLTEGLDSNPVDTYDINDYHIPEGTLGILPTTKVSTVSIVTKNDTNDAIDKVFSKLESKPELQVSIKWDNFPSSEIDMLMKYFDVSLNEIASYIVHKYGTEDLVTQAVEKELNEKTNS